MAIRKKSTRAKKTVRKTTARKASVTATSAAPKASPAPVSFAMPTQAADAMKQWSSLFQSQTPFKMESMMNTTPNFPQFEQFQSQMQTAANQYTSFLNEATSAAEKARTRLTSGLEECGKTVASMAQSNMQRANENMRTLMACKSLNEFADVQNRIFKSTYEATSAETAKLVEQLTKTMAAASEPMNDLTAAAMSKAKKSMAA